MRPGKTAACGTAGLVVCMWMAGMAWAKTAVPPPEKPKLDPANAVWTMKLSNVYASEPLVIHIAAKDGKVTRAFGLGEFSKVVHSVDASALVITEAGAKGTVGITIKPDAWTPPDHKPIECRFELATIVKDGCLGGTYAGKRGIEEVSGMVLGDVRPAVKDLRGAAQIGMEQALGGDRRFRAVKLTIALASGKIGDVRIVKGQNWSAQVSETKLVVDTATITGTVTVEVTSKLMTAGAYTFTLDGTVIGDKVAGRFRSAVGDKLINESGMFIGSIR